MAMDSQDIKKIIKLEPLTKIPSVEPFWEGVINYQQSVISIINMKILLKLQDISIPASSSIIVISKNGVTNGVLVDSVDDIADVNDTEISKEIENDFVQGVVNINNNIVTILNPVHFSTIR